VPAIEAAVSGRPEIALIPLGALNLLPIHAAFVQAAADRTASPLTVRLAPNARVLGGPGRPEGWLTGRLLVIDAADAPGGAPLPRSRAEAGALARRYGARRLPDATRAAVVQAMGAAGLVHFLCHGRADPADPLSSGLLLTDGELTVRDLFARSPLQRQLVVLSACESQMVGSAAPDEVIGLPAALFQAGAFGVIAAQWRVDERAALLVLRRFYEHLDDGTPPARALTAAQNWLRTATLGELADTYPDLFEDAGPISPARAAGRRAHVPYDRPVDWAAFTYTGM
jgi:CHAT domain-containing protein